MDFPAISGFQDQTSGATTVEANILWENPIPPEKMKGHVTLVTLLTIWWTMTTPLMHICEVFDFTPRKSNTYTNEGPTVCNRKCGIGRPQVQRRCVLNIFPARQSVHEIEACKCPICWQFGTFTIIIQWGNLDALYKFSFSFLYMKHFKTLLYKALEMSPIPFPCS